jgi:hypothetical protein
MPPGPIEDFLATAQAFVNWLSGIGQTLSETWGQLGLGIFAGLRWLGDKIYEALEWIYNSMVWFANQLRSALEAVGQWLWNGLQWIGAGLSWIGAQLYSFGNWIYNSVISFLHWVWSGIQSIINWFASTLASIWNLLSQIPASFVTGFNEFFTNMVVSFREKFKMLFFVNTAIPAITKQIETIPKTITDGLLSENPMKGIITPVLGLIATPVVSLMAAEILDSIVPKPASQTINLFPAIEIPMWTPTIVEISKPEEEPIPEYLEPIPPAPGGYTAEKTQVSGMGTEVLVELSYPAQIQGEPKLKTEIITQVS